MRLWAFSAEKKVSLLHMVLACLHACFIMICFCCVNHGFYQGVFFSYILLEATQLPIHFSFIIVNKMQMLEKKDAFEFCGGWVIP